MADRSLTYFLFFIIIYFGYALYEQHQEFERLFKIATAQQETIIKQRQAIEAQKTYIKLLEIRLQNDYPLERSPLSPLHNKLL
jgi:amino acid permease